MTVAQNIQLRSPAGPALVAALDGAPDHVSDLLQIAQHGITPGGSKPHGALQRPRNISYPVQPIAEATYEWIVRDLGRSSKAEAAKFANTTNAPWDTLWLSGRTNGNGTVCVRRKKGPPSVMHVHGSLRGGGPRKTRWSQ